MRALYSSISYEDDGRSSDDDDNDNNHNNNHKKDAMRERKNRGWRGHNDHITCA